jgi:hypothetical protein
MAVTFTASNHFKYQLASQAVNLDTDSIKVLLARSGFVFNKDTHATLLNIKGTITGAANVTFDAAGKTITKATGGFLAAGFVCGNKITVTGTTLNNFTYTIHASTAPTDTVITLVVTDSPVNEVGVSPTITTNDELGTAHGYTMDTKVLTTTTLAENDTNDRMDFTCDNVTWTASGGTIGPSPGAILYSDTSTDNTIIGYIDFDGNQQASDGTTFQLATITIRIS